MNYSKPTSIDDLQSHGLSEREAFVAAAILPHLPDGDALCYFAERPPAARETRKRTVRKFKKRADPIVPGGKVYRATIYETSFGDQLNVKPSPHSIRRRGYHFAPGDLIFLKAPNDTSTCDFSDTAQTSLSRFGAPSTHLQAVDPVATDGGTEFDRKPKFPV